MNRQYAMRKPEGHKPAIQRYSSVLDENVTNVRVVVFGQQVKSGGNADFFNLLGSLFSSVNSPAHQDHAQYMDPQCYQNVFTIAYWLSESAYEIWRQNFDIWWNNQDAENLENGFWFETFSVPTPYRETIAFKEYLRGLSACPYSKIAAMDESSYWGAARDRFEASAYDPLGPKTDAELSADFERDTLGKSLKVTRFPENLCVIRSGVSWADCGEEQLTSYQKNLAPKLDAGMEHLRTNPIDSGCASLRQVDFLDEAGQEAKEAYSLGYFLSFKHLEDWAEHHPSHLAIYTRALAERKKYQEKLELRTYHEIYVLNANTEFLYLNCHPATGLLPYFEIEAV